MTKGMEDKIAEIIIWIALWIITFGLGLLLALPLKWCWNTTMPYLFSLPTITWGKAWCLYVMSGMIWRSQLLNIKRK